MKLEQICILLHSTWTLCTFQIVFVLSTATQNTFREINVTQANLRAIMKTG